MHEIENDLLFSSLIKINYDKRFIRIAQDFIENLSLLAGASKKESLKISLLIEECLVFIIDKYIDCRVAAHIQICFQVTADKKVHIEITDIGPPIHAGMIPSFDIMNQASEAGLWYKVVQGLSDKFAFKNKRGDGWRIQIEKDITDITFNTSPDGDRETEALAQQETTSGGMHIRPAMVGDVPGLINLAYMTYRYSYTFPDYYDGDLLGKYMDEKLFDVTLIEHGSKVIGAYAIKYLNAGYLSAEIGSAMILPAYRSADAIGLIVRGVDTYVRTNPNHCEFFVSSAATGHVRSQKSLAKVHKGFKPFMVFMNMVPQPDFIGIDHKTGGRESLLCVYHLNGKLKTGKVYITTVNHLEIINELIACTENNVEIGIEFSEPMNLEAQISVKRDDAAKFATISIESMGQDWFSLLSKNIIAAIASGMESVKVTIPTASPLPADMEKLLTGLNLVFCGLSLRSLESVDLAYCLTTKPVDFSRIKLYEPVAQRLLLHIEHCCSGQGQ